MDHVTRETIKMGSSVAMESSTGLINRIIRVTLPVTTFMDTESTTGIMVVDMRGHGKITRCMGKAHLPGKMAEYIPESITEIKDKVMVYLHGQTKLDMMATGKVENKMDQG